jgi:hypothetical protein
MGLESAFVAHIENDNTLRTLVGSRIYPRPNLRKLIEYPYITYMRISNPCKYVSGGSHTPVFAEPRYQFDCCATDKDSADSVGSALRALLGNLGRTQLGAGTEVYTVESALALNDIGPEYVASEEDPRKGEWRRVIDIRIQHNEVKLVPEPPEEDPSTEEP